MGKRLKAAPHRRCKLVRGRAGRDAIRIDLPSGGVGYVATSIPLPALAALIGKLEQKIARRRRLQRGRRQALREPAPFTSVAVPRPSPMPG